MALLIEFNNFEDGEKILEDDLSVLSKYYTTWRLKPSPEKTEISVFHLNNRLANATPKVKVNEVELEYNPNPKYLGKHLDRTLSYKFHLTKIASKVRTRNNIIQKLLGSNWGASAETLRISALALVLPVAEYCCSARIDSCHSKLIDFQLTNTMRIITGKLKATKTVWLPVLCNIAPPVLRRRII